MAPGSAGAGGGREMREHLVAVSVPARTKDLAKDAAFRTEERLSDWLARAVQEQWRRDRRDERHRDREEARLLAGRKGPDRVE